MQTYQDNQIIAADYGTLKELAERMEKLQEEGATHHVIGQFPTIEQVVIINGLQFEVDRISSKRGRIRLQLIGGE
jgi:hypothetical protein